MHILFQILFHYRLLQDIEYSSCAISRLLLFIYFIYSSVYSIYRINLKFPIYPSPPLSPLVAISLFSMSVSLFLFCK